MARKRRRLITVEEIDDSAPAAAAAPAGDAASDSEEGGQQQAEVFVKTTLAPGLLLQWRLGLLAEAKVSVTQTQQGKNKKNGTQELCAGPIVLHARGGACSLAAVSLLWCFACLSANEDEEPEINTEEAEGALALLRAEIEAPGKGSAAETEQRRRVLRDSVTAIHQFCASGVAANAAKPGAAAQPLSKVHRRVHLSKTAVLSPEECQAAVDAAEAHAAQHRGWTTGRHAAYPTHDLPVFTLGTAGSIIVSAVEGRLLPELAERFGLDLGLLQIQDLFVAKYSAAKGGLAALEAHVDGSEFSFVLALNKRTEYKGGGTHFLELENTPTFRPKRGFATLFSGKNRHCGVAITSGTRYVLAGFVQYGEEQGDPFSVYNCSSYSERGSLAGGGGEGGGGGGGGAPPVLSMKAKLEASGERYSGASGWDKLVLAKEGKGGSSRSGVQQLYGRKVDGKPEVLLTAPAEGVRGLVELDSDKFARYAALVER